MDNAKAMPPASSSGKGIESTSLYVWQQLQQGHTKSQCNAYFA